MLPNCVGYAQGRLLEIMGAKAPNWKLPACNAEDWIDTAQKNGFKTGSTPKLGSVIVWQAGKSHNESDGCGHVAVVEEIKSNGDIVISQSAYGGTRFYTKTITKASGYKYSEDSRWKTLGFVYCGIEFENPQPSQPDKPSGSIVAGKTVILKNTPCYSSENAKEPYGTKSVILKNTPCYSSESAKEPYGTKSGTFYLWDNVVKNGRIRITNAASRVGVAGQVTCWVNVADIGLTTTTSISKPKPAYQCTYTVKKGDSLWAISTKYLGRGSRYKEIMKLNALKTDVISVGQKIKIPNK